MNAAERLSNVTVSLGDIAMEQRPTQVQPRGGHPADGTERPPKFHIESQYLRARTVVARLHGRLPYIRRLPLPAILIIALLVLVNLVVWAICALILTRHPHLLSTAALAYSLGLRHALDADHISAIDLMTRRLIASGQRPVTVGTFFSLGHSTIVVVTSIVVAATAAGVSERFGGFSKVGGIIGSSVSAAFLILLGAMNVYILYRLAVQLRKVIHMQPEHEAAEGLKIEGGGILFRALKRMFKLIDRPWKMYPLGVMFGLGFDTSSEVALLGISSIQGAKGTSMWLILVFPVLFTVGMCLVDTVDGALMMSLYVAPMGLEDNKSDSQTGPAVASPRITTDEEMNLQTPLTPSSETQQTQNLRVKSPLTFLYYSCVLTLLTVLVALVIGTLQLLTLILNVAVSDEEAKRSAFWSGVSTAGDYYDIIGGAICGAFVVFGLLSVVCYKPWRRWVDKVRAEERVGMNGCAVKMTETRKITGTVTRESGDRLVTESTRQHDTEGRNPMLITTRQHTKPGTSLTSRVVEIGEIDQQS